ncbi:MAG: hypothetical protein WDZ35_05425 [Crocinitomicaceae bacterium]
MEYLVIFLLVGSFVALIVWAIRHQKKTNQRKEKLFTDFAQQNGLTRTTSKYALAQLNELRGELYGYPFQMIEKMEGSSKNKSITTYIIFSNTPFGFDFKIGKEHVFSKLGKHIGMKDIEFNETEFDKRFLIKSKEEDKMRRLLSLSLQNELKALDKDLGNAIRNQNQVLSYTIYGIPLTKEKQFEPVKRVMGFMQKLLKEGERI